MRWVKRALNSARVLHFPSLLTINSLTSTTYFWILSVFKALYSSTPSRLALTFTCSLDRAQLNLNSFSLVQGLRPAVPAEPPAMVFGTPTRVLSEPGPAVDFMGVNKVPDLQRIFQVLLAPYFPSMFSICPACQLLFPPSDDRRRSRSPEARLPRQAAVPHHHGPHARGRSLLPGGPLLRSPAQQEMTDSRKVLRFRCCDPSSGGTARTPQRPQTDSFYCVRKDV